MRAKFSEVASSAQGTSLFSTAAASSGAFYSGRERRFHDRRQHRDRRGEVRFEPGTGGRRQNYGRRSDDAILGGWS